MGQKVDINIKNSVNTHTIAEDVRSFQDVGAPALQNTGIERDGGITNLYETAEAYAVAGDHFITESGDTLQSVVSGDLRLISVGDKQIGQTSAYGVQSRTKISGVDDAAITAAGTYITAAVKGSGIEVCEYSAVGALLHSRTTTFANLAAVLQFFTSLSIIRYNGIDYADSLEFALRLGDQVIILAEATPGMLIQKAVKGAALLAVQIQSMVVFGDYLVVAGASAEVASFDGLAWRYPDGTGSGTGPYSSGVALGSTTIYSMGVFPSTGTEPETLVVAAQGRVSSYRNGQWYPYNLAGVGLWDNGTVLGGAATIIYSITSFIDNTGTVFMIFAGASGRLGSYNNVTGWTVYSAGAGVRDNGTLIGANTIRALGVVAHLGYHIIIVCGDGGRVGSIRINAGVYTVAVYTAGSIPANPTNNATVVGASNIYAVVNFGSTDLVIGGAAGRIGYLQAGAWFNYNGAGGPGVIINNATVVGAENIQGLVKIGTMLLVSGTQSQGSWDGAAWKNSDGTGAGAGPFLGALILLRSGTICEAVEYAGQMVCAGINTAVNGLFPNGFHGYLYLIGGAALITDTIYRMGELAYLYYYRYENGEYITCLVGNDLSRAYTIVYTPATDTWDGELLNCRYAIPQVLGGFTRHIIAGNPVSVGGTQVRSLGLVGYTDFVAFSATAVYPDCAQTTATIQHGVIGFNYSDFTFKLAASATNIYNYLSQLQGTPDGLFRLFQSQTITNVDAYGKLTNGYGVTPSVPFEFRVGLINGVMSFLSAGVLDGIASDTMGTLLTNVGEFDPDYTPDFHDDRILYRYNGSFFLIVIGTTLTGNVFQKIAPEVYKINTISPLNIISMIDESLHVGSSDYNGRMIFEDTAAPSVTATNVAAVLAGSITANPLAEGIFSNSIDVGDKLVYITAPDASNISVPGFRIPYGWQSIKEMISVYIADIYAYSVANDGSELVLTNPSNPVYVSDTRLPLAIGLEYEGGAVNTGQQTIFINPNYDGYTIGNEAKGVYDVFQLYGTVYLFDGFTIYQASVAGNVYGGLTAIAPASGLTFLSATPTQAYFLSAFDNAVFVFNGGRNLSKFQRLNQLPAITGGIFSTRDNALLLETATSFIWVRDDIVTYNLKTAAQTALKLYDTTLGLFIGNDVSRWRYSYASINGSSAVLPLVWQSSYFGQTSGQKGNVEEFFATIYSPGKTGQIITAKVDTFDEKAHYAQTVKFPITPSDYSTAGYYRFRVKPKTQKSLGASLTLTIPAKTVLSDLVIEYSDDAKAIVTGNATR